MDNKTFIIIGIAIAIIIGVIAVFFASGDPDGLESTALMIQGQKTLTGGTPPDAEVHSTGVERLQHPELLGHGQGGVVREHEAAGTDADGLRHHRQVGHQHRG